VFAYQPFRFAGEPFEGIQIANDAAATIDAGHEPTQTAIADFSAALYELAVEVKV
jgi:hypothetical protein